jgi:hypothetical protein
MLAALALNLAGVAMLCSTGQPTEPSGRLDGFENFADTRTVIETIGFTLMLPGIFFASSIFLITRGFSISDGAARVIWWLSGVSMNLMIAARAVGSLDERPD